MDDMTLLLRSAVNTWECDEMGHLNVRHYPARGAEAIRVLLARVGLSPSVLRARALRVRLLEQHIRFHRELRPGTPFTGHGGVLEVSDDGLRAYVELRNLHTGEVAATQVCRIALCHAGSSRPAALAHDWQLSARTHSVRLPDHGAPRGIAPVEPRPAPSLDDAMSLGMAGEYLGLADGVHVDGDGFVEPAGHIGRVSDGIQHFFATLAGPRPDGIGGAVLEFRFVARHEARAGDLIEIRSGLKAVGNRTRQFCHWIFDADSGACLATAEVVAVAFDLEKRRAVELPAEVRARMLTKVIDGLSI